MTKSEQLTPMQQRYIWIAGSFPALIVAQGRGRRGDGRLRYAIDEEAGRVVIFGYQDPIFYLINRGFFRRLQELNTYALTDEGNAAFRKMLLDGAGARLNKEIHEVRLAPKSSK